MAAKKKVKKAARRPVLKGGTQNAALVSIASALNRLATAAEAKAKTQAENTALVNSLVPLIQTMAKAMLDQMPSTPVVVGLDPSGVPVTAPDLEDPPPAPEPEKKARRPRAPKVQLVPAVSPPPAAVPEELE